jgi:hypothetical protein
MKLRLLMAIFLVCSAAFSRAQGPPQYLWTWNGDSGLFQGSFETTADEMQPNAMVGNGLFNLSITSPTGVWLSNLGSGDHTLFSYDGDNSFGLTVYGSSGMELVSNPLAMSEVLGNATLFGELGYWSVTEIPEPSSGSLMAVAVFIWVAQQKIRLGNRLVVH